MLHELASPRSCPLEIRDAKFKKRDKHVEVLAERFRTGVRFPPPPPSFLNDFKKLDSMRGSEWFPTGFPLFGPSLESQYLSPTLLSRLSNNRVTVNLPQVTRLDPEISFKRLVCRMHRGSLDLFRSPVLPQRPDRAVTRPTIQINILNP